MKKIYILFVALSLITTSCIDWGLDELPVYHDAQMLGLNFEYRYTVENSNGVEQMAVKKMTTNVTVSDEAGTVSAVITIPEASGTFTSEIASQVNLTNIIGYASVSTGASIDPLEGAPELGLTGNFTSPVKYKVTAADGSTTKIYTVTVSMAK